MPRGVKIACGVALVVSLVVDLVRLVHDRRRRQSEVNGSRPR
jgi:hypothetical protein